MASAPVVETSVTNNSPSQDSNHPEDLFHSRYVTPWFKPFSYRLDSVHVLQGFQDDVVERGVLAFIFRRALETNTSH